MRPWRRRLAAALLEQHRKIDRARHIAADSDHEPQCRNAFTQRDDIARRRTILCPGQRNRGLAAAVRNQMSKLTNAVGSVHRLHGSAKRIDGEPGDQEFGHVRQVDDHHVAAPNARICEPGSEAPDVRLERLVGKRATGGQNGGAAGRVGNAAIDPNRSAFRHATSLGRGNTQDRKRPSTSPNDDRLASATSTARQHP